MSKFLCTVIFALGFLVVTVQGTNELSLIDDKKELHSKDWICRGKHGILFGTRNSSVVTAQAGSKVILPCVIRNLCDGTVSWIRKHDYHLLTVGMAPYAGDDRFHSVHPFNSDDWSLQIRFVEKRDAGLYECQVTSHPPSSIFVHLKVVEAKAKIHGPSEKYVKFGSKIELRCRILMSPVTPDFIFWYHGDHMINFDQQKGLNITLDLHGKKSMLSIQKASLVHSGNYSCVASNAAPSSTFIHILNDENPAAMQTSRVSHFSICSILIPSSNFLLLLTYKTLYDYF